MEDNYHMTMNQIAMLFKKFILFIFKQNEALFYPNTLMRSPLS